MSIMNLIRRKRTNELIEEFNKSLQAFERDNRLAKVYAENGNTPKLAEYYDRAATNDLYAMEDVVIELTYRHDTGTLYR